VTISLLNSEKQKGNNAFRYYNFLLLVLIISSSHK